MFTGQEFMKNHEESLVMIRAITKKLYDLTEQLATKEINQDPKGFILRENIARMSIRKPLNNELIRKTTQLLTTLETPTG